MILICNWTFLFSLLFLCVYDVDLILFFLFATIVQPVDEKNDKDQDDNYCCHAQTHRFVDYLILIYFLAFCNYLILICLLDVRNFLILICFLAILNYFILICF